MPPLARRRHRRVVAGRPALEPAVPGRRADDQPRAVSVGHQGGERGVDVLPGLELGLRADPRPRDDAARRGLFDPDSGARLGGRGRGAVFRRDEEGDGEGAVSGEAGELIFVFFQSVFVCFCLGKERK